MPTEQAPAASTAADVAKAYEDGKDRRYALLFAVNGGAFAAVKWLVGDKDSLPFLGSLQLWHIGLGMALFTTAMVADIDAFGFKMREKGEKAGEKFYQCIGVLVLLSIGSVIVAGWTLAAIPSGRCSSERAGLVAVGAAALHCLVVRGGLRQLSDGGAAAPSPSPR